MNEQLKFELIKAFKDCKTYNEIGKLYEEVLNIARAGVVNCLTKDIEKQKETQTIE